MQLHFEKCDSICKWGDEFNDQVLNDEQNFTKDLTHCLRVLHSLHIAHKDIKPSNILYSRSLGRYVLCDFGCAEFVKEDIGEVTQTNCAGTPMFMGPEMRILYDDVKSNIMVDLYYNDVHACK